LDARLETGDLTAPLCAPRRNASLRPVVTCSDMTEPGTREVRLVSEANAPHHWQRGPESFGGEFETPRLGAFSAPLVAIGNALIFVAGADRRFIGSRVERTRYATTGGLMLLTAGQATYAAATIASMGFDRPAFEQLPYALFYAAFILLIDRSIVAYVPSLVEQTDGIVKPSQMKLGGIGTRIVIATAASLLMSEAVLLQFFAPRINERLEETRVAKVQSITAQIRNSYGQQIQDLQQQLTAADNKVSSAQDAYDSAYRDANCQLFGSCPGIPAGRGDQYAVARENQAAALRDLDRARAGARDLHDQLDGRVADLIRKQNDAVAGSSGNLGAGDMLAREEAFWHITVHSGAIAFWRVLLSLLLLGIDLAPIMMKLRSGETVHDERIRLGEHLRRKHARQRTLALIAEDGDAEAIVRHRRALERDSHLAELEAGHELRRLEIKLRTRQSAKELQDEYRLSGSAAADESIGYGSEQPTAEAHAREDATVFGGAAAERPSGSAVSHETAPGSASSAASNWILGGRWSLEGVLPGADDGSYGTVFRARDLTAFIERMVVVKVIPAANRKLIADLDDFLRQRSWKRETGARVKSPHVGQILAFGEDRKRNVFYIVSPLYQPGSLSNYVRTHAPLHSIDWCLSVIDQVLAGLLDAGGEGLVHLDVKPSNIVLDDEIVRVIDWGLARYWERKERSMTPVARGSAYYASPEQLRRPEGWDTPLADLYSVGAVLYWLISGHAPYEQSSNGSVDAFDVFRQVESGATPTSLSQLLPGLPEPLNTLVDRWLSPRPKDRVPDATLPKDAIRVGRTELAIARAAVAEQLDMVVGSSELQQNGSTDGAGEEGIEDLYWEDGYSGGSGQSSGSYDHGRHAEKSEVATRRLVDENEARQSVERDQTEATRRAAGDDGGHVIHLDETRRRQ